MLTFRDGLDSGSCYVTLLFDKLCVAAVGRSIKLQTDTDQTWDHDVRDL